jgi:hypothetical protein
MARKRTFNRPYEEVKIVRNKSSRGSARPRAIAIHTTESHDRQGRSDVNGIVSWFNNPAAEASSHIIIDAEGYSTQCVPDTMKAWTIGNFNPWTLNIELIGWASTPRWRWLKRTSQLKKCAKYIAYWAHKYDIPVRRGDLDSLRGSPHVARTGVVTHYDATNAGFGTHTDPGKGFPMDRLLRYARYYYDKGWY